MQRAVAVLLGAMLLGVGTAGAQNSGGAAPQAAEPAVKALPTEKDFCPLVPKPIVYAFPSATAPDPPLVARSTASTSALPPAVLISAAKASSLSVRRATRNTR